jgi:Domain of unknown function (DUF4336)
MPPMLNTIDEGLWTADAPHSFYGLHLGTRMTVVKLKDGGILLHSPVLMTDTLRAEIDRLGPVRHIVCPNLFHHVYAGPWIAAYPGATVHAPAGLAKKNPEISRPRDLAAAPPEGWEGDLVPVFIHGCVLRETLLIHPRSRTLISSDLVENFETSDHLPTRIYLKIAGVHGKIGWSRLLRVLYRDHAAARASIDRLLSYDFDRVIVGHGRVIERGGRAAVRDAFTWL